MTIASDPDTRRPRIFLSHVAADSSHSSRLAALLREQGAEVLTEEILPGENFSWAIARKIDSADAAMILLSPKSTSSATLNAEASLAVEKSIRDPRFRVIPVVLEPALRPPAVLRGFQSLDLSDPKTRNDRLSQALNEIERLLGTPVSESVEDLAERKRQAAAIQTGAISGDIDIYTAERDAYFQRTSYLQSRLLVVVTAATVAAVVGLGLVAALAGRGDTAALLLAVVAIPLVVSSVLLAWRSARRRR
jgi:hypothetical protein